MKVFRKPSASGRCFARAFLLAWISLALVTYTEKRDSFEIYKIPYYEDTAENGKAKALKQRDPSGEFTYIRK
jgi:hypothetical protein